MNIIKIYTIILLFLIGTFLGITFVVIGLKLPIKRKNVNLCDNCDIEYKWYDLIPIVSYFKNHKKCPKCGHKLNFLYSILSIITGLLFAISYIRYDFSYEMITMIIITSLTIIIYVSDFKYYIILDSPLIVFSLLILIFKLIFFGLKTFFISLISGLLLFLFMYFIGLFGKILFKKDSLGGGDVKLAAFFGFTLGVRLSIVSLIIGSLLAFPSALYSSSSNKNREIPFGPYLITGLFIVFIFMEPIRSFLTIIFRTY